MIDISVTRTQFIQLIRVLDSERASLEALAKSQTLSKQDRTKYRRELYDMNGLLAAVLEEDADEIAESM